MIVLHFLALIATGLLTGLSSVVIVKYRSDPRIRHILSLALCLTTLSAVTCWRLMLGVPWTIPQVIVLLVAMALGIYGVLWIVFFRFRGV